MDLEKLKKVIVQATIILLQVFFSNISFYAWVMPVGLSFAFARVFFDHNIFLVLFAYLLSKLICFKTASDLLVMAFELVVLILYYYSKNSFKIIRKRLQCVCFLVLANAMHFYFSLSSVFMAELFFFNLLLEIVFLIYFYFFYKSYKKKFMFFKFSREDYLLSGIFLFLLMLGIFSFEFARNYLHFFVFSTVIILGTKLLPTNKFFMLVVISTIVAVLVCKDDKLATMICICSILHLSLKDLNKYIYLPLSMVIFAGFIYFAGIENIVYVAGICLAEFIFLFIPNSVTTGLSVLFDSNSMNIIYSRVQSQKVAELKSKLSLMAETLGLVNNNIKYLLVGKIDRKSACQTLSIDIINQNCRLCENFKICYSENINKRDMVESMLFDAIEYGDLKKQNITNGFQTYCTKTNIILSSINLVAHKFLEFESNVKKEDSSKILIADELENFSMMFSNFAKMLKTDLKTNEIMSKNIKETLTNNLIDTKEVLVIENEKGIEQVNVIASNEHILKSEVLSAISKITKTKMKIENSSHLDYSGLSLASFVQDSRLKAIFAVSSKAKEKQNGDSIVVTKFSDSKFFVAISDGMGHGNGANKISSIVLSMIKSLFEVGLDENLIVQSVNKLLIPVGLDGFTTLDACVVDLESEVATFVKLGSSISILKHAQTSEMVKCESLPIGIVKNITPTIIKRRITFGDIIFLASDGIVDSFGSLQEYESFINDAKIFNLQKFVDDIIEDATAQSQKHIDDMSIIAVKLLKNS